MVAQSLSGLHQEKKKLLEIIDDQVPTMWFFDARKLLSFSQSLKFPPKTYIRASTLIKNPDPFHSYLQPLHHRPLTQLSTSAAWLRDLALNLSVGMLLTREKVDPLCSPAS